MTGAALAGEEKSCAAQYALEDQLLLEWAALGGDPHAQMAIAQCAFPAKADADEMSPAEIDYAVRWTTIALCEASESPAHDRRDERMRKLKEDANISFRRFGGMKKGEKLNWRERDFMEYRKEQTSLLAGRHRRLLAQVDDMALATARSNLSEQLSRMGPAGLLKLAELSSCEAFGASPEFEAAAWSAASEAWRSADVDGVYAAPDSDEYDLAKIATEKTKALPGPDRRVAALEKQRLLRTSPKRLETLEKKVASLEDAAALRRLSSFALPVSSVEDSGGDERPALITALQFALETLGYVSFVNGPDNDYGPTTRSAVARMQVSKGEDPTAALTNEELRETICRAALKDDPVSLYHVALMYKSGAGFPQNDAKAAAAISRSETAMIAALGGDSLPDWKRAAYNGYAPKIRATAKEFKRPDVDAETSICVTP
ncbi:MAG: hypothetical protein KDE05_12575 [Parvularculaceae bacterium]|nr:hypothetical protein [Parvularculaceae bacterium]